VATTSPDLLTSKLGKMGLVLWAFANGLDETPVSAEGNAVPMKSIGNSTTTPRDLETPEDVCMVFYLLSESVASRLRGRFGHDSVLRGRMYFDRVLAGLDAKADDHMNHPHSYFERGNRVFGEEV
jgi:nucleotidyltransferase/DNA polymerase involved in DNA repair